MTANESLLDTVLQQPKNDAARLAYADWLEGHGDPEWAAYIRLQIELDRLPSRAKRRAELEHQEFALRQTVKARLLGPAHAGGNSAFFNRGWAHCLILGSSLECLEALTRARGLELVHEVEFDTSYYLEFDRLKGRKVQAWWKRFHAAVDRLPFLTSIRALRIGEPGDLPFFTPKVDDACFLAFLRRCPRLEILGVHNRGVDTRELFGQDLPYLTRLSHGASSPRVVSALATNRSLKRLDHLILEVNALGRSDDWAITNDDFQGLVRAPQLRRLKYLHVEAADVGVLGCQALVSSGLLGKLVALKLPYCGINDEAVRVLESARDCMRLKYIDLSSNAGVDSAYDNRYSDRAVDRLRQRGIHVLTTRLEHDPDEVQSLADLRGPSFRRLQQGMAKDGGGS